MRVPTVGGYKSVSYAMRAQLDSGHRPVNIKMVKVYCPKCNKAFSRRYNMERHVIRMHDDESSQQDQAIQVTDSSDDEDHDDMKSDIESDEEQKQSSLWDQLWSDAWTDTLLESFREKKESLIEDGMDYKEAHQEAYSQILPKLRRNIMNLYASRWLQHKQMSKDHIHQKILATKR